MADLAIEETNRIRASLGMKPLPVPSKANGPASKSQDLMSSSSSSESEEELGSTLESRQAQGYDNWKTLQDENAKRLAREKKATNVRKAREAAQRFAKLEGKGLADEDELEGKLDTKTWLLRSKRRRKQIEAERLKAERLEKELAEREKAEYTEKDLQGVNVAHAVEDFEGGEGQILTLADQSIEINEEQGDELEALGIKEKERLEERLGAKKKKPVYDPTADDGENKILEQYDETIEGKKRKRFQLEGQTMTAEEREAKRREVGTSLKKELISLDLPKEDVKISDYIELVGANKIKKPKKKKAKSTRKKTTDEDDIFPPEADGAQTNGNSMDVDAENGQEVQPKAKTESSFVDDDDLQAALAQQRRAALKKRKRVKPGDIARQLREEARPEDRMKDEEEEAPGLVIDETSEFVSGLQRAKNEENEEPRAPKGRSASPMTKRESVDTEMADIPYATGLADTEEARTKRETSPAISGSTGLAEEQTVSQGLGSTLTMLTQRGLLKAHDNVDLVATQRREQYFLFEKKRREAEISERTRRQRERDRLSGKLEGLSAREREEYARHENKARDVAESRAMNEVFNREYKPNVELKYVDDKGRQLSQKEAFKYLSHQFHGKGSGKGKLEKHLKKVEDEKSREAKSLLDATQTGGMDSARGAVGKKRKEAGVRLA